MTKHTKGPWEADGISVRSSGSDGRQIALCEITVRGRPYNETYDEAISNARLIAAAPDLLEAMQGIEHFKDALNWRQDHLSKALLQWIEAGCSAISKATA